MRRHAFRAMGTEVAFFVDDESRTDLLDDGEHEFHRLEGLLSRFRPESELSRLNRERSLCVGPELAELVQQSLRARDETGGRFDPTVHDAVVAAGYDRSFELVAVSAPSAPAGASIRCGGDIAVAGRHVALARGVHVDLGGIAKGWAADRVLSILSIAGPALVDAGGDVVGVGRPWPIGLETPAGTITLELRDGALATSGRDRRRWWRNGHEAHHVIDPATAASSESDVLTVTAVAPTATDAEVRATSLFLASDAKHAAAEADAQGLPAIIVTRSGETVLAGGLS
jgi:FAD:protein FMN transferase